MEEIYQNMKNKSKISLKRTFDNNLYVLGLIHASAPGYILLQIAITIIETLSGFLSGTYLLRYAINGVGSGMEFSRVAVVILAFLAVILLSQFLGDLFRIKIFPPMSNRVTKYLNRMVYEKAAKVDLSFYEDPEYFDKLTRAVSECSNCVGNVTSSLTYIVWVIVGFSANLFLVLFIDPVLLLFALIPLIAIPLRTKTNKLKYERDQELTKERRIQGYSRRTFYLADYAKEMRTTNMPALMLRRFNEAGKNIIDIVCKYGIKLGTIEYIVSELKDTVTALGAMTYSVWKTLGVGTMQYGDCVVIVNSINTITYTLTNASDVFMNFQKNALYIDNLREFLDYDTQIRDGDAELPDSGDIVFDNVSFTYHGAEKPTLKGVNMRFGAGERIAIVGHNGAGKSTIVKLLMRLYDCDGSIKYGGVDIKNLKVDDYRGIFSSVMQDSHLFALSLKENVLRRPASEDDDEKVMEALKNVGLCDKVSTFEKGIDTMITKEFDKSGELLSGGEAQKLAISTIYTRKSRFVVLDEPSSALDPIAEDIMYRNMLKACEGRGVIFISHRLSSAVSADRIYVIEDGYAAESGTHSELMEKGGIYAAMFKKQAENYKMNGDDESVESAVC